MKDETSIFGAKPERLDRLVFEALQDSEAEEAAPTATLEAVLERPGGQIGRYKLLSILGEGGMGIVYLAEQVQPIKRQMALKVISPVWTRQGLSRASRQKGRLWPSWIIRILLMSMTPELRKVADLIL